MNKNSKANGTETIALPIDSKTYKLYGYKWFSSATDANMALTLARISDEQGTVIPVCTVRLKYQSGNLVLPPHAQGGKGLTLFYVPVKENGGQIEPGIAIVRLKNKLGTKQLPTAELLLDGVPAIKVSSGSGFPVFHACDQKFQN